MRKRERERERAASPLPMGVYLQLMAGWMAGVLGACQFRTKSGNGTLRTLVEAGESAKRPQV